MKPCFQEGGFLGAGADRGRSMVAIQRGSGLPAPSTAIAPAVAATIGLAFATAACGGLAVFHAIAAVVFRFPVGGAFGQVGFGFFFGDFLGHGDFTDEHPLDLEENFALGKGKPFFTFEGIEMAIDFGDFEGVTGF